MTSVRRGFLPALLALLASARSVHAEPEAKTDGEHRLEWNYPRFRPWEYTTTLGVSLTAAFVELEHSSFAPANHWSGILYDDAVRNALRARSPEGRARAAMLSNIGWQTTEWYPVVVDSLFVPLVTDRGNIDVAGQMLLLDWQAQSLAFFLLRIGHHVVGRSRPSVESCASDPNYDSTCDPNSKNRYFSFFGGHPTMAFSGAGLTCAHHLALPLYGSSTAGWIACGMTLASASATAVLRIVADKHWSTDVTLGILTGFAAGFGMPYLLHYGPHWRIGSGQSAVSLAVIPIASPTSTGAALAGVLWNPSP